MLSVQHIEDKDVQSGLLRGDESGKKRLPGASVSLRVLRGVFALMRDKGRFHVPYFDDTPYCITDESALKCRVNFEESIKRNIDQGNPRANTLRFQSKKQLSQAVHLRAQYFKESLKFYPRLLHNKSTLAPQNGREKDSSPNSHFPFHHEKMRKNNNWPNQKGLVDCDSKLLYHRQTKQYSLIWTHYVPKPENQGSKDIDAKVCAIDPGVRTFATWYSPTEGHGKIGDQDASRIVRLGLYLDDLISRTTKVAPRKRNSYRKAQARIRLQIKNLVEELHKQTVNRLLKQFDVVVMPRFNSHSMARKKRRKISSKTVRQMLTWSHCSFLDRLQSKAEELGKKVYVCSEAYTSKTCGNCGELKHNLGGAKRFKCPSCKIIIDRDVNGARNILLRALVDEPLQ